MAALSGRLCLLLLSNLRIRSDKAGGMDGSSLLGIGAGSRTCFSMISNSPPLLEASKGSLPKTI